VRLTNFAFVPAALDVAAGDTLVFTNADVVPHTTTAQDGAWDSKAIEAGATWRVVARTPGRHVYDCTFHPTMKGTVTVR
jgi:plastocyanin